MTHKEEEKIREYTAALIAYMQAMDKETQQRAYDYLTILIERTLDK